MTNFKTLINSCWLFFFCCFQTSAQETGAQLSICNQLGITSLKIESTGPSTRAIYLTANKISVNEKLVDLNENRYDFSKSEKSIGLIQNLSDGETQGLEFDGETFVFTKRGEAVVINDENLNQLSPGDLVSVVVLANLLKEADVHFDDEVVNFESPMKASIKYRQCDHVEISAGASRSVTERKCEDNTVRFLKSHPDCVKYGSCDTSCVWGDHLCFATAFFLCNGSTCFFN